GRRRRPQATGAAGEARAGALTSAPVDFRKQAPDSRAQRAHIGFDYAPYQAIVDRGVLVDQDVPECDDAIDLGYAPGDFGSGTAKRRERLSDDFELAFDRRTQHLVALILIKAAPA